jgi:hypothetical protein
MRSVYDVDVILLLATALAGKRRPAELTEIVAAAELVQGLQGTLPAAAKLRAAYSRLATHGLVAAADGGFALTAAAQEIVVEPARNATMTQRQAAIREKLAAYAATDDQPDLELDDAQWQAAVVAHRASAEAAGKNLLIPKPKADDDRKPRATTGPGLRRRKPLPARRRKD